MRQPWTIRADREGLTPSRRCLLLRAAAVATVPDDDHTRPVYCRAVQGLAGGREHCWAEGWPLR